MQTVRLAPLQPALPPAPPVPSSSLSFAPLPAPKKEEKKPPPVAKTSSSPSSKTVAPVKKTEEGNKKKEEQEKEKIKREKEKREQREKQEKLEKKEKRREEKKEREKKQREQKELAAAQAIAQEKERALKEELAKIRETSDKINLSSSSVNLRDLSLPKELNLQIDALFIDPEGDKGQWSGEEISYRDEVAYRLKRSLKLPEYGAVKIKLTLDRLGKVLKMETMESESKKNKAYVEKDIPKILFSPFGSRFRAASDYTFLIILHNES